MLISSAYSEGVPQADGRWHVVEEHTAADGRVFRYEYLSDGALDPQMVLEERAARINAILAAREAARQSVTGTEVPWTKHEFLSRFTQAERIAIRTFAKGENSYASTVDDFMEMLNASDGVHMSLARPGIEALRDLGLLSAERAAVIGAD